MAFSSHISSPSTDLVVYHLLHTLQWSPQSMTLCPPSPKNKFRKQPTPISPNSKLKNTIGTRINGPCHFLRSMASGVMTSPTLLSSEGLLLWSLWIYVTCPFQIQWSGFTPLFATSQRFPFSLGKSSGTISFGYFEIFSTCLFNI